MGEFTEETRTYPTLEKVAGDGRIRLLPSRKNTSFSGELEMYISGVVCPYIRWD